MELNKIYHCDNADLMSEIETGSIDVILTDPPYLYLKNQKLDRPFDEIAFFSECKRILKKDGFIVLFGRGTSFYRWNCILADMGFTFKEEVVWNKLYNSSPVLPIQRFHETVSIHTKGNGTINRVKVPYVEQKAFNIESIIGDINRIKSSLNNTAELDAMQKFLTERIKPISKKRNDKAYGCTISPNSTGVFHVPASVLSMITDGTSEKSIIEYCPDRYTRIHPTQKPVRLLERLLALVSKEGDIIFDPFSGSGSTAEACINSSRKFIACEIDKEYYDLSVKRINDLPLRLF